MRFTSNLQPIGEEEFRDSVFLTKIRDPFALDYMHRQNLKMLPVQEEEYRKASGHCSYAFDKDYPWGTELDEEGNERLVCKCQNMQCAHFKSCNPDFEIGDLYALLENEVNAFLKYSIEDWTRKEPQSSRKTIHTQELEKAYWQVLSALAEEKADEREMNAAVTQNAETEELIAEQPVSDDFVEEIPEYVAEKELFLDASTMPHVLKEEYLKDADVQKPEEQAEGFGKFVHAEYDDILNAGPNERILVNAGPGTGKTWTLIHKIAALVMNPDIEPENILVLSFSRAAVEEIEKRLKEAEIAGTLTHRWHAIDFSTLDSFASRMILYAMINKPELLPKDYSLSGQGYDDRIETAREIIRKQQDILNSNVHVLIDEIQDLVGCRAKLVLDILHILDPECGFTLLGDACQSLYDYQAEKDQSVMSSAQFYEHLFDDFEDIGYYRFDENHRQCTMLRELITPYRDAILTGTPEQRRDMAYKIRTHISDSGIDLNELKGEKNPFDFLLKSGSVAILTRSNGEALKISEFLKSAGIVHRLGRPDSEEQLNDWIAAVFTQYPNEMINLEQFRDFVNKIKPDLRDASVESCWRALTENVTGEETWYHVSTILNTILSRGKNRALFRYSHEKISLTVSNIHRAKGKEYDTVLIPEYSLESLITDESDPVNEHKVCYVACTRPKNALKTVKLKKAYISRDKKSGRCFEGKYKPWKKGQRFLTYMEVGLPGDIDILSLANEQSQTYIRDELKEDDRIVLVKIMQKDGSARYSIRPEKKPGLVIGYTSAAFVRELDRIECILSRRRHYDPAYYPSEMDNIVVTKKTSCIVAGGRKMEGMKYYGEAGIWYGFAVSGFAHIIMNRY